MAVMVGTDNNDNLTGSQQNDSIFGLGGSDFLDGNVGQDFLVGGDGDDEIWGGFVDTEGDSENDLLIGGNGNDSLWGGEGKDTMYGGKGNDILVGEGGNGDFSDLDFFNDRLFGEAGDDVLLGSFGNDVLIGGSGNDSFNGAGGRYRLSVMPSLGRGEIDTLTGGTGSDTFSLFTDFFPFNEDGGPAFPVTYDDANPNFAGLNDYALITDFNLNEDFIRLTTSAGVTYSLGAAPNGLPRGTGIFIDKPETEPDELIAVLQGVSPENISLEQPYFQFVTI